VRLVEAVKVYPGGALYHRAVGYCLGKLGDRESAVQRIRGRSQTSIKWQARLTAA